MSAPLPQVRPVVELQADDHTPVVIVGAGACGLTAALALHRLGVDCVVLERDAFAAGSTALSSGFIPAPCTQAQQAQGITDSVALDCAQEAAGQLRYEIEAAFSQGLPNTPMAGSTVRVISGNFITARPVGIVDGVDFQHSGLVRKVDVAGITQTLGMGAMVLLSPFGFSPTGEAFNLSMEEVATSVAIELQADKLIFLTEVAGLRIKPLEAESEDNPIDTELPLAAAEGLLKNLPSPLVPTDHAFYLQHCVKACKAGVERSHILPFAVDGVLLLEIYVHDGIGTMVVDEKLESLREATHEDVGGILQLIEPFERDGTLVKRDRNEIERDVGQYTVIEHDGVIFACAAMYPYPEAHCAELAALTVSPASQGQGDGEKVLKRIEQRCRAQGIQQLFVLTTRTMHWFLKRGFVQVPIDWLPQARLRKYSPDRKSVVLVKKLPQG